ncbi:MAG TPA: DUF2075 domain-containing protein [Candidatus Polarisedimenticolaceae bacterium]|nr:DUF2075 domain-containing protein [Candidatus Polarisedimenticolaceae bacterium]
MRLYSGLSTDFIRDAAHNRIAAKLKDAYFREFRHNPPPSEVNSWQNSLRAMSQVVDLAGLHDHGVLLEYQLPMTSKRLDCMVCGQNGERRDQAVIVELKQWQACGDAGVENLVTAFVGGRERDVLHPAAQVNQYERYLEDSHTAFYEGTAPVGLASCAYLHNYYATDGDTLFTDRFASILSRSPVFTADDVDPLQEFLRVRLSSGHGEPVLRRVEQSKYRPSKKLLEHVGKLVKGHPTYVLIDEQLVAYERVLATARAGFDARKKEVIIIRGGPGTGKSVIAMNLLGDLSAAGLNAHYATGSKAFTETLRKVIGSRGSEQFKYFNSYANADVNAIDVLICDEAHRVRETSNSRYTKKTERSTKPQVRELFDAAKVSVFFVDDKQSVRPGEIGTTDYLRKQASDCGCEVREYTLEAQFRCAGSDAFVNWINNTLGIERTANVIWEGDERFDFRLFESPGSLDEEIRRKAATGVTARLTAGFCWPWSTPNTDGTLVEDVVIGNFRRPWNARPDAGKLARGIPNANLWAYDSGGIDQVGCVYTAQGFEFDFVGVIVGNDLRYDPDTGDWIADRTQSHDRKVKAGKHRFAEFIKNTYRVLLSRGLRGCYVHFMDKETERFVRSRVEWKSGPALNVAAESKNSSDPGT